MPISNLDPKSVAKMTGQQIADLALAADQECRRLLALRNYDAANQWDIEAERLATIFRAYA